jgi:hypothetical protein
MFPFTPWAVESSDILVAPHFRPVLLKHGPTEGIDLDLPANLKPGPLKAQIEPADPGEQ